MLKLGHLCKIESSVGFLYARDHALEFMVSVQDVCCREKADSVIFPFHNPSPTSLIVAKDLLFRDVHKSS